MLEHCTVFQHARREAGQPGGSPDPGGLKGGLSLRIRADLCERVRPSLTQQRA
jgi:hypothetical protein